MKIFIKKINNERTWHTICHDSQPFQPLLCRQLRRHNTRLLRRSHQPTRGGN